MTKQLINIGQSANDKAGDPLRTAFSKVNNNFDELYNSVSAGGTISYTPTTATDWNGTAPITIQEAIDRLAAAFKILNSGTGA